jgi:cytidylate kinase
MIITVDGLSGSGKGTLSQSLAKDFRLPYLETGLLWRKVAAQMYEYRDAPTDDQTCQAIKNIASTNFDNDQLRSNSVSKLASIVSGFPNARKLLDERIIDWANGGGGGVLDGREGGITHAPHADHKFFLVASAEARARRRSDYDTGSAYQAALTNILDRDAREIARPVAPSIPAIDAIIIDTTFMDAEQTLDYAKQAIESRARWNELNRKAHF